MQVVAANNAGTCYVWRMMRGANVTTHFEPLHKLKAHSCALHTHTASKPDADEEHQFDVTYYF